MKIIQSNNIEYRTQLIALYLEAFSKGNSSQYVDLNELNIYIDRILEEGIIYLAFENSIVTGALFCCPLVFDNLLPDSIKSKFDLESSVYIAEMMVGEQFRGKGIGSKLLDFFFHNIDKKKFSNAFIRVWDKNLPALKLYLKFGFTELCQIDQIKRIQNDDETFVMKKIYLHKKLK